jgi:hypothetical protein
MAKSSKIRDVNFSRVAVNPSYLPARLETALSSV